LLLRQYPVCCIAGAEYFVEFASSAGQNNKLCIEKPQLY
jgi:hypothetical protein